MEVDLLQNFRVKKSRTIVINNPIDFTLVPSTLTRRHDLNVVTLVSVGRLSKEKGITRIIMAISRGTTPFHYYVIGDGPMKIEIQRLIKDLSLEGKITLVGNCSSPFDFLSRADFYLQGSYYEGFPNSMIEAMACGTPAIAWEAPGGHNEVIIPGVNGWIIRSDTELSHLIDSQAYLQLNKDEIVASTRSRYEIDHIISLYEAHFQELLQRRNENTYASNQSPGLK